MCALSRWSCLWTPTSRRLTPSSPACGIARFIKDSTRLDEAAKLELRGLRWRNRRAIPNGRPPSNRRKFITGNCMNGSAKCGRKGSAGRGRRPQYRSPSSSVPWSLLFNFTSLRNICGALATTSLLIHEYHPTKAVERLTISGPQEILRGPSWLAQSDGYERLRHATS